MSQVSPADEIKRQFRVDLWPAWIALVCSLALTVVAWRYTEQYLERQLRLEFDAAVSQVRADLNTRILGYTQTLRAAAALFATGNKVTPADWRNYIAGLQLEQGYPAFQAVAFARTVSDAELDGLVRAMRNNGAADFAVTPSGRRDRYVVNVFVEPAEQHAQALGYDMWPDAERREAMQRARDSGAPAITRKIQLKIDDHGGPVAAFIMYFPVMRKSGGEVYGYVLSPLRMSALMAGLLEGKPGGLALSIHDGTRPSAENLFFGSGNGAAPVTAKFMHSESMVIGGRPWTLNYASTPELESRVDLGRSAQVLAGGLLTSALLFTIAWSLGTTRDRAMRLARDMTGSLRESEERIRLLLNSAGEAIYGIDLAGRCTFCNPAGLRMLGWNHERDLLGTEMHAATHSRKPDGSPYPASECPIYRVLATGQALWVEDEVFFRADGSSFPVRYGAHPIRRDAGVIGVVVTFTDATLRKAAEEEIRHLAFYDSLTRLPNRRLMHDRLARALSSSARRGRHGALMLFDLDDFKTLNDTLGHDVGDQFLVEVARRMEACTRQGDTVARLGGDEFVVILEDLDEESLAAMQAESVAVKIQTALNRPYELILSLVGGERDSRHYHCTASIGIALFRDQVLSVDELMKRADTAMYQAKAAGRNTLRFFDPDMQAVVTARAELNADLRAALREGQFLLYYQPQVDGQGRVTGAEALLRWRHPRRGLVYPAEFIPLAEDNGLILALGRWVLESACQQLAAWGRQEAMAGLTLAVNVSALQFRQRDFVTQVLDVLRQTGANPWNLKLEVTESVLLHDMDDIIAKMTALKAEGVSFALDDFGTGYSSLSYLRRLPLYQLKIDASFVRDLLAEGNDTAITRTIIALGQSLGLAVIAEGVETEAQREFLARLGCYAYQGYLFGHPGEAQAIREGKPPVS